MQHLISSATVVNKTLLSHLENKLCEPRPWVFYNNYYKANGERLMSQYRAKLHLIEESVTTKGDECSPVG